MINATQIVTFSLTTLDVLAGAKAAEMSLSMRLCYRSFANSLKHFIQQIEDVLAKRQAVHLPPPVEPIPEPITDLPEAEVQEALEYACTQIETYLARRAVVRPTLGLQALPEDVNIVAWSSAMIDAFGQTGPRVTRRHPPSEPAVRRPARSFPAPDPRLSPRS